MKSHEITFRPRDLARALLPTLLVVVCLALLLRVGNRLGWLPEPAVWVDPDLTVLRHQALASRSPDPATVVLVGDSTCLVGVGASRLTQELPGRQRVLNLSLVIGLGLDVYGDVVSDFAAANPGQVRAVVLLVTPTKFAGPVLSPGDLEVWQAIFRPGPNPAKSLLGARLLRRRILSYALDAPLRGHGAVYYGFSSEIDDYMSEHDGSLLDFGRFEAPRGEAPPSFEYHVSPRMQARSRAFRATIPPGAKLIIGLTPWPASLVSTGAARRRAGLLREWNRFISADVLLTNLPPALPDAFFSPTSHLNRRGQRVFTELLGEQLAAVLQGPAVDAAKHPND